MELETAPYVEDGVSVVHYPISMTGKVLRKRLGIPSRLHAKKSFKVCAKFKGIKQRNRLGYLIKMAAAVKKERIPLGEMYRNRAAFNSHKLQSLPMAESMLCYVCLKRQADVRHHVVPLSKGGRNKRNNIVPLCNSCHSDVHPHMHRWKKSAKREAVASRHSVQPKINGPIAANLEDNKYSVVAMSA